MAIAARVSASPFSVFRNRNFLPDVVRSAGLNHGSAVLSLTASIYVFRLTNSALSVGLMLMATAAPSLLVGLFAGVLVDRYDRKKIMIAAELIQGVLAFLIPILVPFSTAWLYIWSCSPALSGQFFNPAYESVLPEVASDAELAAANSLIAISGFGSTAIGFAVSGLDRLRNRPALGIRSGRGFICFFGHMHLPDEVQAFCGRGPYQRGDRAGQPAGGRA